MTRFALTGTCVPWRRGQQNRLVTAGGRMPRETCENPMVPHLSQRAQTCPSAKQHAWRLSAAAANRRGMPTKEAARSKGQRGRGEGGGGQVHKRRADRAPHAARNYMAVWLPQRESGQIGAADFSERAGRPQ